MILRWHRQQHGLSTVGTAWPHWMAGVGKEHHRPAWLCPNLGSLFAATFQTHESSRHHLKGDGTPAGIIKLLLTSLTAKSSDPHSHSGGLFLAIKIKAPHQEGS